MTLICRYAVVSWCRDLTSPDAVPQPLAVLLVAKGRLHSYAAAVGIHPPRTGDRLTDFFLEDVAMVIRSHIEKLTTKSANIDTLLEELAASLRGSLHVSSISEEFTQTVGSSFELAQQAETLLLEVIAGEQPAGNTDIGEAQMPAAQQWRLPPSDQPQLCA